MPTVRDVMQSHPVAATSQTPLETLAEMMRDNDVGCLPVVDDGQLTGIVTDRDIVVRGVAMGRHPAATFAGDVCSHAVHTVGPDDDARAAAQLLREHALRRLPVVDDGRLAGILSIGDLARVRDPDSPLADISSAPPTPTLAA